VLLRMRNCCIFDLSNKRKMTKPKNISREIPYGNGIVEIWVYSTPKNRMHSAPYPVLWGYLVDGVKYTSRKKAYQAIDNKI
jgi:hypothetical protein